MKLWIRSQDKKHLLKCEAFLIEGVGNNRFGIRAFTKNYDFDIANYETKERALEVLDDIQNILKPIIITTGYECECKDNLINKMSFDIEMTPTKTEIKEMTAYVYEMPEE